MILSERADPAGSPVSLAEAVPSRGPVKHGMGLGLSGGGYRAMVFHVGALWRLNETGLLRKLQRVSSVSGGSITAALLGLRWGQLGFEGQVATRFQTEVVTPIRRLASRTIDEGSILSGLLTPGTTIGDKVADAYRKHLYGDATLADLPDDSSGPRFVINATNVQSGVLWRFMKPYMRDYRVGKVPEPKVSLAVAVAASSAFPPVLSPVHLELESTAFTPNSGFDLQREPFTTDVVLSDGGVYDNLGLETIWKRYDTILVSDAGGRMKAEEEPKHDWARHAMRVLDIIDNQVRSLRKRQVIDSFKTGVRKGAYWGIRTNIADYSLRDAFEAPFDRTLSLAETPTRLKRMDDSLQERLINWGYAVCDAALRKHVDPALPRSLGLPYPSASM